MKLFSTSIPHVYEDTYTGKVEGFLYIFNPLSEKGVAVLNKEAAYVFLLIDNKRKLGEILKLAQKKDTKIKLSHIIRIFKDFINSDIIYFDNPKTYKDVLNKKPRHLDVWLHITNQCNLRCTYCYVYKTQAKMTEEVANKAIYKIFTSAQKHGFKIITFKFSGGESLLEFPFVLRLVNKARKLGKKYNIQLDFCCLTNGVLLTEETAKLLKANNIRAAISIDGLEKYHNKTRIFPSGEGTFRYVVKGLENLLKADVPFNVMITISLNNIEGIPELTKILLSRNIPFTFNFYRENPFVSEEIEGDDRKLVKYLKKAYTYIYDNPPRYTLVNGLLDRVNFQKPHLFPCGMGNSYVVVRHDGKMTSCQMTLENPIGSINGEDLIKTMQNGNFVKPNNLTVQGKIPCKICQWKYICCGGCPLLTYRQKGRYDTNSPYCEVYKALIPEVLKIEAKRIIKYGDFIQNKSEEENISFTV